MEQLGINLGLFIFQVLNFSIVAILLYAWAYKPILNALEKRRKTIQDGLEDARVAAEARQNAEKEAARIVAEAQSRAGQVMREATERAEAVAREVRTQAEAEAAKERDAAMAELQQERERNLGDLRGQVAALSLAVAQKLIGDNLDERRQRTLIDEFFSGIRSGQVQVLEGAPTMAGVSAEVTSALPLTAEEKEMVRSEVLTRMGGQGTVTFRVDPGILGGLIVRVREKVWDASLNGQLENLRQTIA
ncbi:MAG: ATP synthase F0 subunit B [Chloroflexota bacterium]|nr:MAG: ATP synthase F0 subunit B [Chloroflexota bacterium]